MMAFGVMLGAFGAHALRDRLDDYATGIYEKAVFYHFVHALGLLAVPVLSRSQLLSSAGADRVCWLLFAGILIFSGSLYALAATGVRTLGAITPFGGTAFIAAWLLLAWELFRTKLR
jgi:uncharacterized membrane protein YgdD (TMEM256/DUF423 family)